MESTSTSDISRWNLLSILSPQFVANVKSWIVFGNQGTEALILTRDDELYALGSKCMGTPNATPCEPILVDALSCLGVVDICCGAGPHALALTREGTVYAWGNNSFGQLGLGHGQFCHQPRMVEGALSGVKVSRIACGGYHSLALTDSGRLFSWGLNSNGQLGIGNLANQMLPQGVSLTEDVVQMACGHNFTLALTKTGYVYGWGSNEFHQVGAVAGSNQLRPQMHKGLRAVVTQIACGYAHSLALSDEGELWGWGSNTAGQLTCHQMGKCVVEPVCVGSDRGRLAECAAVHSCNFTAVKGHDGVVSVWGQIRGHSHPSIIETSLCSVDDAFASYPLPAVSWRTTRIARGKEERNALLVSVKQAFDDRTTADLAVKVDGKTIWVHKVLLKMRCEYFRSRFGEQWDEAETDEIEISQFTYPVMRAFFLWIYTDELNEDSEEVCLGLLDLSNCYCEEGLKQKCALTLEKGLCVENAAMLYAAAILHHTPQLEQRASQLWAGHMGAGLETTCLNHLTAVVSSEGFAKLDKREINRLLCKAAEEGLFKR